MPLTDEHTEPTRQPHHEEGGTILLTGATGTVGSEVVRQLATAGERPRVLVRDPDKARVRLGNRVDYVSGDLDDPESLAAGLEGVNRVFLLTRQSSRQPEQERAFIDAAVRAGVRHVVKLSVFRADARSPLQIGRQHRQMERSVERPGLSCTILRPTFFMQNLFDLIHGGTIRTAAESGRVAMIDVRDVAAVAVDALTSRTGDHKTYTLTGPEALSFDEVAAIVSERTGTQVRHVPVPPEAVRIAAEGRGAEAWFAEDLAKLHTMLAAGYEELVTDDVATVTGTSPRTVGEFAQDFTDRLVEQETSP
jgi:uncharacterized protein YbjT (DUF2867 family)